MLQIVDLVHGFGRRAPSRRSVLDGLRFVVPGGAVTALVGPRGSGTSTTLRIVAGALRPDAGAVLLDGVPLPRLAAGTVGHVPETRALYLEMTARDQLAFVGRMKGLRAAAARSAGLGALDRVGLLAEAGTRISRLDPGDQRLLQVAAALVTAPAVLLIDEPFIRISDCPRAVAALRAVLRCEAEAGTHVLVGAHSVQHVEELSDHVVLLDDGRVRVAGARDALRGTLERLFSLQVRDDAGWVRECRGVRVLELDGDSALFAATPEAAAALLREAVSRDDVVAFAEVPPSLSRLLPDTAA